MMSTHMHSPAPRLHDDGPTSVSSQTLDHLQLRSGKQQSNGVYTRRLPAGGCQPLGSVLPLTTPQKEGLSLVESSSSEVVWESWGSTQ